jgi:Uma2 family endonuclease
LKADGFFGAAQHVELIDGRFYVLSPISDGHSYGQADVMFALRDRLGEVATRLGARVVGSATLLIDGLNAPEFDAAVMTPTTTGYFGPDNALLLVEVTLSSRSRDLRDKVDLYGAAGVAEYWAVDRRKRKLHVFRQPQQGRYSEKLDPLGATDVIAPLFAPDVTISVADLL